MNSVIVAFGSNINAEKNIPRAKEILAGAHTLIAESRFLWTDPIGPEDQPAFLNGVCRYETVLDFEAFRKFIKDLEHTMGRQRDPENPSGPRPIDLDILVWNNKVVHKDFFEREFVQAAVCEVINREDLVR